MSSNNNFGIGNITMINGSANLAEANQLAIGAWNAERSCSQGTPSIFTVNLATTSHLSDVLVRHLRSQIGAYRQYPCPYCPQGENAFFRQDHLDQHLRGYHRHHHENLDRLKGLGCAQILCPIVRMKNASRVTSPPRDTIRVSGSGMYSKSTPCTPIEFRINYKARKDRDRVVTARSERHPTALKRKELHPIESDTNEENHLIK
ncbi:hypothetical protein BGZ63DRAFT_405114 [Mariannaea sp. PMI_226]|nr:hypothetical protein BGZ63DRAFT_405114 [Mariannaea sp. PMI_226]